MWVIAVNFDQVIATRKHLRLVVPIRTHIYVIATLTIKVLEIKIRRSPLAG